MTETELARLAESLDEATRIISESIARMPRQQEIEFQHDLALLRRRLQKLKPER